MHTPAAKYSVTFFYNQFFSITTFKWSLIPYQNVCKPIDTDNSVVTARGKRGQGLGGGGQRDGDEWGYL